jgi:NADPH-dependent ferric siderophore reductase
MPGPRRAIPQHQLTVIETESLGPHLVRVVLTGDSLADFVDTGDSDDYVKLFFLAPGATATPPYDVAALRAEGTLVTRTYTVRWVDRATRRLAIDFVTHGDAGLAGPWAQSARPGEPLVLAGPGSGYHPEPGSASHLLAGDLSALPAISSALESMPDGAAGLALIEIESEADRLELAHPEGVQVRWLLNPDVADVEFLARAVSEALAAPGVTATEVQVFAHGERESIKAVRRALREADVPRERISISGYWARGRTEDAFQAEKREPIGKID